MIRSITFALTALFASTVALLALLNERNPGFISAIDVGKALLQLGVVSVVGAVVSLLIFEYQREKNQFDKQRESDRQTNDKQRDLHAKKVEYRESLLLGVLSKALTGYSRAKKARRLLRARAIHYRDGEKFLVASAYDEYMDFVNDAQLELESLARDVETSRVAFSTPTEIVVNLRRMEKYLGELIGEYENQRPLFESEQAVRPLKTYRLLVDYLASASSSKFKSEVIVPYHEIQEAIRQDLLHPSIPALATDA